MALRAEERPALTLIDGGRQAMTTPMPRYDAIARRRELQELIENYDDDGLTVAAIDAYADRLATRYPGTDAIDRGVAHAMLTAYMDGWLQGYEEGHEGGYGAASEFALLAIERARPKFGGLRTALDWVASCIEKDMII